MGTRSLRVPPRPSRSRRSIGSASLRPWYFSHANLIVFFLRNAMDADLDHSNADHRALLQELLWCWDEGETAAVRFDHVVGRDHKRQIPG
jgi:hypothetical protein